MPICPCCGERFTLVEPHDCRSGFRLSWAARVVLVTPTGLAVLAALFFLLGSVLLGNQWAMLVLAVVVTAVVLSACSAWAGASSR